MKDETKFQSTHPHGVRLRKGIDRESVHRISIHAPARGATVPGGYIMIPCGVFQSTHPHGVRHQPPPPLPFTLPFQSTHPHGVRPYGLSGSATGAIFQSTHPHGVRQRGESDMITGWGTFQSTHPHGVRPGLGGPRDTVGVISIHAPARGATRIGGARAKCGRFQSTHPHGVRRGHLTAFGGLSLISIHAPARSATVCEIPVHRLWPISIHAPARSATTPAPVAPVPFGNFNPRTRTECDL